MSNTDPALASLKDAALATPGLDAQRWAAMCARDATVDGQFVYAVRSTGVYCRPSCPSRTAKREHVEFHDTPASAQQAGFRACKRCRPDEISLQHRHTQLIAAACRAMETNDAALALSDLATAADLSAHHFHRVFKQITGVTPKAYAKAVKTRRMQAALARSGSVTEAIYDAGFSSSGRFYDSSAQHLGMTPRQFRSGARQERIRYAIETCTLGMVIIAATPRGVCNIEFADSASALIERLQQRFPAGDLAPGDPPFQAWVGQVLAYIEQPVGVLDLPLDIQGTVFQQRVWQALREIPCGSTASYAQVATTLGQPQAARAVATACASNPVAVAIPCHRVVRSDGSLSGYRWGPERKRELLRRERP